MEDFSISDSLETENLKMNLVESRTPQMFGIQKGGSMVTHPVIHKNRIYAGDGAGNVYCLGMDGS